MYEKLKPLQLVHSLLYDALKHTYRFHELEGTVENLDGDIHYITPVRTKLYALVRHIDYFSFGRKEPT